MGCGNAKEKIENEMIAMKMERTKIQMERRNNIKLLEDIDKRKIIEPSIPDYLAYEDKVKRKNKKKKKIKKNFCIKLKKINKATVNIVNTKEE